MQCAASVEKRNSQYEYYQQEVDSLSHRQKHSETVVSGVSPLCETELRTRQ